MKRLLKTPKYQEDIVKIYEYSLEHFGRRVATETARQIAQMEEKIRSHYVTGKIDPEFHSHKYKYVVTANRQKLFFEEIDDAVVMVVAGYEGRNWAANLNHLAPLIDKHIAAIKAEDS